MATPSDVPLRQVCLSQWSAEEVERGFDDRPLLLQVKRAPGPDTPQQMRIILFVHGLNSTAKTWLPFLSEAFSAPELQSFDFGLFNYQTSMFSRLNPFQRLPRVEDWARVLASTIQTTILNQERYDSFVLVGHSMGGLVSKFAVRCLVESDMPAAMRLHSLFTYGTPNHGSSRVSAIGSLLSPDLALLRAFSASIHDLQTFWNSRISAIPDTPGKTTVHQRAVISVKDYWVAPMSGISALPERFVLRLASSHAGLIRPSGATDPRVRWFTEQLRAIERWSECSLVEIRNGPGLDCFLGEDGPVKFVQKLFQALFVLDSGGAEGVAEGDVFGLRYEPSEVKGLDGRVIDRIPGSANLLRAIEVKEHVAYCTLERLVAEPAVERLISAVDELKRQGVEAFDEQHLETLVLSLFGRRAVKIPRRESDAWKGLEEIKDRILDQDCGSPTRERALRELLRGSRLFLADYPGSVMAASAAFHEAWSTVLLERYEEAEGLFERFCEQYPFSVSVGGARNWIEEIRHRVALRDSGNAAERQLELAEYLMKKDVASQEEAMRLGFEAYTQKPNLLAQITLPLRVAMACYYVFSQVLGLDTDTPEAIVDLLGKYRSDAQHREQMRAAIQSKVPFERTKLLVQLLDSASADFEVLEQALSKIPQHL
jgi:pimeloyl-ACP methyl ester carboxylesterase